MITIAGYKGTSFISKAIRLLTYSCYSHTAAHFTEDMEVEISGAVYIIPKGSVIEAWSGGVRLVDSLSAQHTPGTPVDLFSFREPLTKEQEQRMAACLMRHALKKTPYSYVSVLRFVPIVRLLFPTPPVNSYLRKHIFCSELVMEATIEAGTPLLERCPSWEIPPRDPPRSPLVKKTGGMVTV